MSQVRVAASIALLAALGSCGLGLGPEGDPVVVENGVVEGTGMLAYSEDEGGYPGILGDDGALYLPASEDDPGWDDYNRLLDEHPLGTRVEFRGELSADPGGVIYGTFIHLEYIRLR